MYRMRYGGIEPTSGCQSVYGLMGQAWNEWNEARCKDVIDGQWASCAYANTFTDS